MKTEIPDSVVEDMARAAYQSKNWDDPTDGPGEKMKEVWRGLARRAAPAAVEWARKDEREACLAAAMDERPYVYNMETGAQADGVDKVIKIIRARVEQENKK